MDSFSTGEDEGFDDFGQPMFGQWMYEPPYTLQQPTFNGLQTPSFSSTANIEDGRNHAPNVPQHFGRNPNRSFGSVTQVPAGAYQNENVHQPPATQSIPAAAGAMTSTPDFSSLSHSSNGYTASANNVIPHSRVDAQGVTSKGKTAVSPSGGAEAMIHRYERLIEAQQLLINQLQEQLRSRTPERTPKRQRIATPRSTEARGQTPISAAGGSTGINNGVIKKRRMKTTIMHAQNENSGEIACIRCQRVRKKASRLKLRCDTPTYTPPSVCHTMETPHAPVSCA